jgi:hypothetical protein
MQPVAANAACANFAVWTQDGDSGEVKKWSTDGTLLTTLQTGITAGDIAVSSDLTKILAFANGGLDAYSSTTGAFESTNAITGGSPTGSGAAAGVIAGGKILTDFREDEDTSSVIVSIDLSTYVGTDWAALENADASVPVGVRGGVWSVAGDVLQLPDNDILVVANNSTVYADGVILLRINKTTPTQITAVGVVASSDAIWGAARGGDEIFLASETGDLLKLASVPTATSLDPVTTTTVVTGQGSFWGAAGSDDSTEGNAVCQEALADTGLDLTAAGLIAFSVIAAGGIALLIRRRAAQG